MSMRWHDVCALSSAVSAWQGAHEADDEHSDPQRKLLDGTQDGAILDAIEKLVESIGLTLIEEREIDVLTSERDAALDAADELRAAAP